MGKGVSDKVELFANVAIQNCKWKEEFIYLFKLISIFYNKAGMN